MRDYERADVCSSAHSSIHHASPSYVCVPCMTNQDWLCDAVARRFDLHEFTMKVAMALLILPCRPSWRRHSSKLTAMPSV